MILLHYKEYHLTGRSLWFNPVHYIRLLTASILLCEHQNAAEAFADRSKQWYGNLCNDRVERGKSRSQGALNEVNRFVKVCMRVQPTSM